MSEEESAREHARNYFRDLVAMILENDAAKKEKIDARARAQIEAVKEQIPGSPGDETLVVFLVSVAFTMAKLMATPVQDVGELMERIFDNNVVAAASLMGVYDLDSKEVPHYDPEAQSPAGPAGDMSPDEYEQFLNRQYL
jgi:hypothetical protein